MKPRLFWRRALCAVAVLLLPVFAAGGAQLKPIRLRNQLIPPNTSAVAVPQANFIQTQSAVSGLFLIQFKEAPGAEARTQLAAAGVDLLHYVPEQTFLARFRSVQLAQVRALPFVRWVGQYLPEHKIHRALQPRLGAQLANQPLGVSVLLAPRADPADVAAARRSFVSPPSASALRSGTVLRGSIPAAQLDALARSDSVLWIEPAPHMKLVDEVASKIVAGDGGQNTLLTQSLGYDGRGVKVAVADSGLNNGDAATMHPDLFGRTPAFFYYGALDSAADEHSHGTHVAGIIAGNGATGETDDNGALYGLGVAPGASIIAQRIFDAEGNFTLTNDFPLLTQDATDAGADIGSNSWGDDVQGRYDLSAMEYDELVRDATGSGTNNRPFILEFSAGNAGPGAQTIDSPAVAKNVIATGASENDRPDLLIYADGPDAMADFSSRGPCEDGRIKPDLVAPGTWISSLQSASASDQYAWMPIDSYYQYQGGTSQAGPHVSGAAAVFVQYYRSTHTNATPSPALVKAALINSAAELDTSFGSGPVPNMDEGWGRADLTPFFDSSITFEFIDQTVPLTNGQVFENRVLIAGSDQALKITLAYTDVPGLPAAIPALVNDLDLEVLAPDGRLYRGNQFNNGESIPDPSGPDTINNVEAVYLSAPVPGEYVVRVRARNVVEDILGAGGAPRQDFALVISGPIPAPDASAVLLDRASYTAPSQIHITVIDSDQAGQPSLTVLARSSTETNGETVLLTPAGIGGSFTGAIATVTGPAQADGRLQITNNDTIQVSYFDASAGATRLATARADLVPPLLGLVSVTNSFGQALVSWASDESATSIVRYGTNSTLSDLTQAVTNAALTTSHALSLGGLMAGRTYYFYVVSADEAGNISTNSNGGALYSFVAAPTAPVLLVDEYIDPLVGSPPISGYTDPLDQLGVTYDFWDVATLGPPTNVLGAYRVVIWRVPELSGAWDPGERAAISNYLHSGGGLFVASMQLMTRLETDVGDAAFIHNVLQVQSYVADDAGSTGAAEIIGSANETVGAGLDISMDYSVYDDQWTLLLDYGLITSSDISETMTPKTNATAVFRNDSGDIVGLRWPAVGQQAPGRLVFLSFPLDAVPMGAGSNDRANLVRNVLSFLAPGAAGLPDLSLDSPEYTLPSLITIELGDLNLAGQGAVTVAASSTTQTNAISVTLRETINPGEFIGSFTVVPTNSPAANDKLRARNGDSLRVAYFDAAANSFISANATIDINPPAIANIAAEPDYQQAVVSWDTAEPADALVEFGESLFLGRSAYDANFTTSHAVTLDALATDRLYYYRVLSRDVAGNLTMDDNGGKLYTFRTLKPLAAPWSDTMDTGATNWSTYSDPASQCEWTLGVPDNGQESSAHSPPDAWGSNLRGPIIDSASTFLISPAIELPAGAAVQLHFWHSYDFTLSSDLDIYEQGDVLLITNNSSTTYATLASYSDDFTTDWEEQVLDLTPYAGQIVYLAWDYELFSLDSRSRPGWLVDDVSLTVSFPPSGTLVLSNNLWQTTAMLSGAMARTNKGLFTVISNAPPGQYVVTYSPVPYYLTPPPQTNTLAADGTLLFQGNYTFPDANGNGISDLWEQYFFGAVSTNRTGSTDTDGNGMSDYAKFIAGTDPVRPPPPFHITVERPSNAVFRLNWPAYPGQQYLILTSTNLVSWSPYTTNWLQTTQFDLPISATGARAFFKIQASSMLPADLRLSIQRAAGGALNLVWPSSIGRGYCVQGSTNAQDWAPISDWFQATNTPTVFPLLPAVRGVPYLFRIQVKP